MCGSLSEMHQDEVLDREKQRAGFWKCIYKLKNSKTSGNDGLVGQLLKYGVLGMVYLLLTFT